MAAHHTPDDVLDFENCPGCGSPLLVAAMYVIFVDQHDHQPHHFPICSECARLDPHQHPELIERFREALRREHGLSPMEVFTFAAPSAPQPIERNRRQRKRHLDQKKLDLAYVALYLDQAESAEFAELQINATIERSQKPVNQISLLIDLVATPEQIQNGVAHRVVGQMVNYVKGEEKYRGLRTFLVGITDDDKRRALRDTLLTRTLTEQDIDDKHLFVLEA